MRKLPVHSTKVSSVLQDVFRCKHKMQLGAHVANIQLGTLQKKKSGSPVELRGTFAEELIAWAEEGLLTPEHMTEMFSTTGFVVVSPDSELPAREGQTIAVNGAALITEIFQDGKFDDNEKKEWRRKSPDILKAILMMNYHAKEQGVTTI